MDMSGRTWMVAGAVIVALVIGFVIGRAVLGGEGDDERVVRISTGATGSAGSPAELTLSIEDDGKPITDGEIARISTAATAAVGGGRVTDIERSDDPGEAYEVEVVKGGAEIDVALDENLERVPNQRFSD
jgi:hypothetical protein